MKSFKLLILLMSVLVLVLVVGCKEAKEAAEGADDIADQVTGKAPIEKRNKLRDQIKSIESQTNKKQQEALDKIK